MIFGVADHPSFEGSLREFLDFSSKLKVDIIELRSDRLELLSAFSSAKKASKIKDLLSGYNFRYFIHAPSISVNLASLNPNLLKASEKAIIDSVKFAAEIGAELVVSHVGRLSRDYPQKLTRRAMKNAINSLRRVNQFSNDSSVVFTVENDHKSQDYVLSGYPEQISFLISNVGCKLTFDVGHANTLGKPEEFIELLKKHIVSVHLHDNDGTEDKHLPIGKGTVNFEGAFKGFGKWILDSPLVVECHSFSGLQESISTLRQKFSKITTTPC